MKYNLIRNSYFRSGSAGNVDLSWAELESLMDQNLTSSGVTLTTSGILYLETDLSQRIKVDGIRLYASDLSKSSNINFYYKNAESDSYTLLTTYSGAFYYYTTIIDPSAPQFMRVTVSGIAVELYEFLLYNDDYIVAFGQDGQAYAEYLDNTPVGEAGDSQAVAIYNNDTSAIPVTGYTTIDYTDTDADSYIKISASENGTYRGVEDGVLVENNNLASTYIWDMGQYDNTKIDSDVLMLNNKSLLVGDYMSPIFKKDDAYSSSYFIVDGTTVSGITSISYDSGSYNGTIRVRNSHIVPLVIDEFFWCVVDVSDLRVYKYNLYDFSGGDWSLLLAGGSPYLSTFSTAANRRTGHAATSWSRMNPEGKGAMSQSKIIIYDRDTTELYSKYLYNGVNPDVTYEICGFDTNIEFDKLGGIWGYNSVRVKRLLHFDHQLLSILADVYTGSDFLYDFAVELNGIGVWYTDKSLNLVHHLDSSGTVLQQITLQTPRAICGTSDNGCWVVDNTDLYARRYAFNGDVMASIYLGRTATRLCTDYNDGFWYYNSSNSNVYHLNSAGTVLSTTFVYNVSRFRGLNSGCIVWSDVNSLVKHINNSGVVTHTFDGPSSVTSFPAAFSHNYTNYADYHTDLLPVSYDPVWGTGGSLEWKEVSKDGYFLPKEQYHQVELTLRTNNASYTPYVNKLLMAPSVKIEDIPSKSYKNMYIKTDIPSSADVTNYEARLKTWWRVEA